MSWFDHFPGTNFHELNLDWIINTVKKLQNRQWMQYKELRTGLDEETDRREEADKNLQAALNKETSDRISADDKLQAAINKEVTDRTEAVAAEQTRAEAAEKALDEKITAETNRATTKETELDGKITAETARATEAETALGTRIDELAASTDDKLTEYIKKDGTTETTAAIPFAAGVKTGSITGLTDEGVAIEAPLDLNLHQITGVQDASDPMGAVNLSQMQTADAAVLAEAKQYTDEHGIPAGGTTGQVLAKSADTDYTVAWTDPQAGSQGPAGPGVAAGGTAGQVLAKVDGTDYNTHWIDAPSGEGTVPHLEETYTEQNGNKIEYLKIKGTEQAPTISLISRPDGSGTVGIIADANNMGRLSIGETESALRGGGVGIQAESNHLRALGNTEITGDQDIITKKYLDTESANTLAEAKSYTDDKFGSIQISGIQSGDKIFAINNTGAVSSNMTSFAPLSNITVEAGGHTTTISNATITLDSNSQLQVAATPTSNNDVANKAYVDDKAGDPVINYASTLGPSPTQIQNLFDAYLANNDQEWAGTPSFGRTYTTRVGSGGVGKIIRNFVRFSITLGALQDNPGVIEFDASKMINLGSSASLFGWSRYIIQVWCDNYTISEEFDIVTGSASVVVPLSSWPKGTGKDFTFQVEQLK